MPRSGVIHSKTALAGGILALAALAAYHNSFSGPFVFDDVPSISGNATIRHLWPLWTVLSPPSAGLTSSGRPVLNLAFAINYALGGNAVWGYHAANLLIHILAGLALFGIMRRTLERSGQSLAASATGLGFAVALIWTVHPLQTESVTYIVQRAESQMGLFYLLTLYCFIRLGDEASAEAPRSGAKEDSAGSSFAPRGGATADKEAGRKVWGLLSFAACLFGMGTKEVMASAPVIVFFYDRTFISGSFREAWRRHRALLSALACTWLVLGCAVVSAPDRGGTAGFGAEVPWSRYLLAQFPAMVHYLRLAIWPDPLVFDYGAGLARSPWEVFPAAAIVILLIVASLLLCFAKRSCDGRVRHSPAWRDEGGRAAGFAGIFFFAILAPTSLVPVATEIMAEHRMYLALAPVLAVVVGCAALLGGRILFAPKQARTLPSSALRSGGGLAVVLAVAIVFICLTARRNEIYRSDEAVWSDTVAKRPEDERAHFNLGNALVAERRVPEAIAQFEETVRLKPDYANAHYNLGIALSDAGRMPEAIAQLEEAVRLRPDNGEEHYSLGYLLTAEGRIPEAITQFEETVRLKPDYADARNNLANALMAGGRMPEAIAQYEEALRLKPDYVAVHLNLAIALLKIPGRTNDAVAHLEAVLRLQPGNDAARQILYGIR